MFKYRIEGEDHTLLGQFESAHGLSEQQQTSLKEREVSVFGFERGQLTSEGRLYFSKRHIELIWVHLLTDDGKPFITLEIQNVRYLMSCGEDSHITELLLAGGFATHYSTGEWSLLQQWSSQMPQEKNQWVTLRTSERRHWLVACVSVRQYTQRPTQPAQTTYNMDAKHVTDYPSFFIALGEAINGPGGYFGRNVDALSDCLCGDFGAKVPFTLNIHNFKVAQRHLTAEAWRQQHIARACHHNPLDDLLATYQGASLWEVILDVFHERGVQTHLLS